MHHTNWKDQIMGKNKWASKDSDKPILPPEDRKYIQKEVGNILYYARAVDPTMMITLGTLSAVQLKMTEDTKQTVSHLLD